MFFTSFSILLALLTYWIYPIFVIMLSVLVILESGNEVEAVQNALAMVFLLEVNNLAQFLPGSDSPIFEMCVKKGESKKIREAGEWARCSFLFGQFAVAAVLVHADLFYSNPHVMLNPTRLIYGPVVFFALSELVASILDLLGDLHSRLFVGQAHLEADYMNILFKARFGAFPMSRLRMVKSATVLLRFTAGLVVTIVFFSAAREALPARASLYACCCGTRSSRSLSNADQSLRLL